MTLENGTVVITKDDERKALSKIQKIVEGLGKESYIATAFAGVFKIAEDNIDNDWGVNAIEHGKFFGKEESKAEINELKKEIENLRQDINRLGERAGQYSKAADFNYDKCQEYKAKIEILNAENESLQLEIMKLKARLFDMQEREANQNETEKN